MNYSAMIQNRRSVHAFREKEVPSEAIGQLRSYYEKTCPRLVPEIATELIVLDKKRTYRSWRNAWRFGIHYRAYLLAVDRA